MRGVFILILLALLGCKDEATRELKIVDKTGKSTTQNLNDLVLEGRSKNRGYIEIAALGNGTSATFSDANGKTETVRTDLFPKEYRLFLRKQGGAQLVRFRGTGDAPAAGVAHQQERGGRAHRTNWTIVLDQVVAVRFN